MNVTFDIISALIVYITFYQCVMGVIVIISI